MDASLAVGEYESRFCASRYRGCSSGELTESVRLDRHAGADDGGDGGQELSRGRLVGVDGSGDEDGDVIGEESFCSSLHLWEGDRRSKSGV